MALEHSHEIKLHVVLRCKSSRSKSATTPKMAMDFRAAATTVHAVLMRQIEQSALLHRRQPSLEGGTAAAKEVEVLEIRHT
eukprot:6194774-Pleurochrysis_carterae.AAC.1